MKHLGPSDHQRCPGRGTKDKRKMYCGKNIEGRSIVSASGEGGLLCRKRGGPNDIKDYVDVRYQRHTLKNYHESIRNGNHK
jgi:hypothetical protein